MITTYRFKNINNDESKSQKKSFVHFWWVIAVLLFAIILLVALLCTNIHCFEKRIMTYLSFTATLLSIVLSIFAIMYSFYSMQEASRQWSDVTKAVNTINNYTETLSRSTQQMLEQVIKINRDLGSMQEKMKASNEIPERPNDNSNNRNIVSNAHRPISALSAASLRRIKSMSRDADE